VKFTALPTNPFQFWLFSGCIFTFPTYVTLFRKPFPLRPVFFLYRLATSFHASRPFPLLHTSCFLYFKEMRSSPSLGMRPPPLSSSPSSLITLFFSAGFRGPDSPPTFPLSDTESTDLFFSFGTRIPFPDEVPFPPLLTGKPEQPSRLDNLRRENPGPESFFFRTPPFFLLFLLLSVVFLYFLVEHQAVALCRVSDSLPHRDQLASIFSRYHALPFFFTTRPFLPPPLFP